MGWIADLLKEIPSAARYKAELEDMEKENEALKAENARLRAGLQYLEGELTALKAKAARLDPDAEKILALFAKHESATPSQVARAVGVSKGAAEMHLEDLETLGHLSVSYIMNQEAQYSLAQSGRRHLHAKGLL